MNTTLARLQVLQRQTGAQPTRTAATAPRSAARTLPAGVAQLRALLRLREVPTVAHRANAADRVLPGTEIAPGLYLTCARVPGDPLPTLLDGTFDRRSFIDPQRVLFFDTETTGLAGGTGTRAFMIGAARWRDGALEVRQLTITTLAAERAMLAEFARWLEPTTILASYNGKSYDAPLLRTRYRLARMADPTTGLEHVDLLYPSRRRWRGVYENCRLCTIERRVLGVVREDDLPGSDAPAAWLTYLHGGSARNLCRVAAHNRQDVVSLARLLLHLAA
ncbi:MAG TPA: ribonuclease H-like domain-containing protein [Rhodanobacteraceae bacterium]|nr:ribonuclease H-like domain-containing protein [Rhodanobacteraceae bacterium]